MNHQNIVTTASIQQLWSSAKNQLQLLRDKLAESEEKNRFLETELQNAEHKTKEEEIRSEMQRQEMQSLFEEERREYEQQIHEEHESKKILEENSNTLRRDLQNMQVLLQEKETLQDIRNIQNSKEHALLSNWSQRQKKARRFCSLISKHASTQALSI